MDAGDIAGHQKPTALPRALFLIEAFARMGYDAATLGPADLELPREVVLPVIQEAPFPILSANLLDTVTGEGILPHSVVLERGDLRIGVTAVLSPTTVEPSVLAGFGVVAEDPEEVLRELLPELREKCDVVVLLCRSTIAQARVLAESLDGWIDVLVLGSGSPGYGTVLPAEGGALYLVSGSRGRSVGVARLELRGGHVSRAMGEFVSLSQGLPEDEEMAGFVEEFHIRLNEIVRSTFMADAMELRRHGDEYYMGADSCRPCHRPEFLSWKQTGHASAFETLVEEHSDALPECVACHVVGAGEAAGYNPRVKGLSELVNVQCEVCHGPGSEHSRDGTYGDGLGEKGCTICHDADNSPDFDLETYWPKIAH